MGHRVGKIRNLRVLKTLRGDTLTIDLGRSIEGNIKAWMKREPNSITYREFEVKENRFLELSKEKTNDYYFQGDLIEKIEGRWFFDVELDGETIYTGTIFFINDITGSNGTQVIPIEGFFNIDGGTSGTVYLESQKIDLEENSQNI